MSAIKLHLEMAELDAVQRYAAVLHVSPEDVLYCALNRLMLSGLDPLVQQDIKETKEWRRANLPLWSDTAASVHPYESKPTPEPMPSRYL